MVAISVQFEDRNGRNLQRASVRLVCGRELPTRITGGRISFLGVNLEADLLEGVILQTLIGDDEDFYLASR